jgi:DNA repair protein RecN (Recombination protein N)
VELTGEAKVEEIARMLGGLHITEQSLAHAREILAAATA